MPRQTSPLSDSAIKAAKPKERLYKKTDGQGLYLEIKPSGSKLWRFKYRFDGREMVPLSFGAYPDVSLQKARELRAQARATLVDGIDPGLQKKAIKAAQKAETLTFEDVAREWFAYRAPLWEPETRRKAKLYLENDIISGIGLRPINAITRPELVMLVRKVEAREAFDAAKKVRQWLRQIFSYALARGVVEKNPATDLDVLAAPAKPPKHHPNVPFSELPELLSKLDDANLHMFTRAAIRLLTLTAVRPGELRGALWSEIDLVAATWTIPKQRMKARRPHVVPLPRQALAILRQLHETTGRYPLLFPGQQNPEHPMSSNTVNKALRQMGYEKRQTGHGFRHLLSTELNGRGYNRDWIERQLAHGDTDEIRDTYNHATYLEQRRKMMQEWADSIDALQIDMDSAKPKQTVLAPYESTFGN
jgi:integrase